MVLSQSGRITPGKSGLCLEAFEMGRPQRDGGSVDEEHNPSLEFYSSLWHSCAIFCWHPITSSRKSNVLFFF